MRSQPIAAECTAECPSPVPLDQFLISPSLMLSPTIFRTAVKKKKYRNLYLFIYSTNNMIHYKVARSPLHIRSKSSNSLLCMTAHFAKVAKFFAETWQRQTMTHLKAMALEIKASFTQATLDLLDITQRSCMSVVVLMMILSCDTKPKALKPFAYTFLPTF